MFVNEAFEYKTFKCNKNIRWLKLQKWLVENR